MLLNLLSPIMQTHLLDMAYIKTRVIICGLLIMGVAWSSIAIYFYCLLEYPEATGALISAIASFGSASIASIYVYILRKKTANNLVENALQIARPVLNKVIAIFSNLTSEQKKALLPVATLMASYFLLRKKR